MIKKLLFKLMGSLMTMGLTYWMMSSRMVKRGMGRGARSRKAGVSKTHHSHKKAKAHGDKKQLH